MKFSEELTEDQINKVRLAVAMHVLDFELSKLRHADRGEFKRRVNNYDQQNQLMLHQLLMGIPAEHRTAVRGWIDNLAAGAWEVLDEYFQAKDKAMFLLTAKCFNEGLIHMEGQNKPTNELDFEQVGREARTEPAADETPAWLDAA